MNTNSSGVSIITIQTKTPVATDFWAMKCICTQIRTRLAAISATTTINFIMTTIYRLFEYERHARHVSSLLFRLCGSGFWVFSCFSTRFRFLWSFISRICWVRIITSLKGRTAFTSCDTLSSRVFAKETFFTETAIRPLIALKNRAFNSCRNSSYITTVTIAFIAAFAIFFIFETGWGRFSSSSGFFARTSGSY